MDPLSVTASLLAVLQAIGASYNAIQQLRGLPDAFREVHRCLPLVTDTLALAESQARALDEPSRAVMKNVLDECETKAVALRTIFDSVAAAQGTSTSTSNGGRRSVLDVYRTTVLPMGKAHKVEALMEGLLEGLGKLAMYQQFRTAALIDKMTALDGCRRGLANVEPSVPDADFEAAAAHITQHVAPNATGYQAVNMGRTKQVIGRQTNYHAGTINFGPPEASSSDLRISILRSLQKLPYRTRKDRNPRPVPGTCEWFVRHDLYQQWRAKPSPNMLWVSADPGTGKSVLARLLVDREMAEAGGGGGPRAVCYFFFKDDFADQKTASSALACILHQLFSQRPELLTDNIIERFKVGRGHEVGSFQDRWDIFTMALSKTTADQDGDGGEVVVILDAFDECEEREQAELADAICQLYTGNWTLAARVKFLVTSRPYDSIQQGFHPVMAKPNPPVVRLRGDGDTETKQIADEIELYIKAKVSEVSRRLHLAPKEKTLLLQSMLRIPHRTYLWAHLTLDVVQKDATIDSNGIEKATSCLPRSVDEAYERILDRSKHPDKAKKLLQIVVAATRPLTLQEMAVALALENEEETPPKMDVQQEDRFRDRLRDLCGLFVSVVDAKVYLLHQTAREFLVREAAHGQRTHGQPRRWRQWKASVPRPLPHAATDPCRSPPDPRPPWRASIELQDAHRSLYGLCVRYLLRPELAAHKLEAAEDVPACLKAHLFLDYAARNCAHHFRAAGVAQTDDSAIQFMRRACDMTPEGDCQTWFFVYWVLERDTVLRSFTPLIAASYFGLTPVVQCLLDAGAGIGDRTTGGRTALSVASECGFHETVKVLLKGSKVHYGRHPTPFRRHADVDEVDDRGRTPLSYAASNGHAATVNALLKAGAIPKAPDYMEVTPVDYAMAFGHLDLAKQLLPKARAERADRVAHRLLMSAIEKNYEPIFARLLRDNRALANMTHDSFTPLFRAVENDRRAMVRQLLELGAKPNSRGNRRLHLVHTAASLGHGPIMRLLLEHGADVDSGDEDGNKPLHLAAQRGHNDCAQLLLDHGAYIESRNTDKRKALHLAAVYGRKSCVQLLIDRGADIESVDRSGRTALHLATVYGHAGCAQLLLDRGAYIESRNTDKRKALHLAAVYGRKSCVQLLIDRGADIESVDGIGRTALHLAVRMGHTDSAQLLLEHGANIESVDAFGCTALQLAVKNDFHDCALLLLDRGANIHSVDRDGRTALHLAAVRGDGDFIGLLLDHGANIESVDGSGRTALQVAAQHGFQDCIQELLDRGANIRSADKDGNTVIHLAVSRGHTDCTRMLLDHGANINSVNTDGDTALHVALRTCNSNCSYLLLSSGAAGVNLANKEGFTPLHLAAASDQDNTEIARRIIQRGAAVKVQNQRGETPLWLAIKREKLELVRLLLKHHKPADFSRLGESKNWIYQVPVGNKPLAKLLRDHGLIVILR